MAPTDPVIDEAEACPYLGLPDDPGTRFTFATPAHRCHVKRQPRPIDLGHQGAYCLSSDFPACKLFRASAAAIGARAEPASTAGRAVVTAIPDVPSPVVPPPTPVADARSRLPASAPAVTVVTPSSVRPRGESHDTPRLTLTERRGIRRRVLFALVVIGAAVLIGAIVTGAIGPWPGATGAVAPGAVATGAVATATINASASTTRSPSPSSVPSASSAPTAVPSPTATPWPEPSQTIHVVKAGESLTSIAALYGVTPQAIQHANKIKDPNLIHVGQKLIVPQPQH